MDKEVIFDYDDVIMACEEGNLLNAIKLLMDRTGCSLKECKLCVDSFIKEYYPDQFPYNSSAQEPTFTLYKDIKIESKSQEIKKEIELLYEKVESLDEEKKIKSEEILNQELLLESKKQNLSNLINSIYSRDNIQENITEFYTLLNTQYYNKYNSCLAEDEAKFKADFYEKIKKNSVESIFGKMLFKHNSGKRKAKVWAFTLLSIGIAILLFTLAHEHFRPYDVWEYYKTGNGKSYNFIGWMINIVGSAITLVGLGNLLTLSIVPNNEVLAIINSDDIPNKRKLVDYLHSIHKLPEEIKKLIK